MLPGGIRLESQGTREEVSTRKRTDTGITGLGNNRDMYCVVVHFKRVVGLANSPPVLRTCSIGAWLAYDSFGSAGAYFTLGQCSLAPYGPTSAPEFRTSDPQNSTGKLKSRNI